MKEMLNKINGIIRTHSVTVPEQSHIKLWFSDLANASRDLYKLFIEEQINLLSDLQINDNSCRDSGYIDYKISQLKDQLK